MSYPVHPPVPIARSLEQEPMVRSLTRALPSLTMALMFILLGTGFFAMESGAAWTFFAGVGALLVGLTDLAKLAYLAFCEHRTEARRSGLPSRF